MHKAKTKQCKWSDHAKVARVESFTSVVNSTLILQTQLHDMLSKLRSWRCPSASSLIIYKISKINRISQSSASKREGTLIFRPDFSKVSLLWLRQHQKVITSTSEGFLNTVRPAACQNSTTYHWLRFGANFLGREAPCQKRGRTRIHFAGRSHWLSALKWSLADCLRKALLLVLVKIRGGLLPLAFEASN